MLCRVVKDEGHCMRYHNAFGLVRDGIHLRTPPLETVCFGV